MRLIDADKLQRTEGIFTYRFTDDLDILSCCAYRYEDVETAPTVKAIPIEWIERKLAEHWYVNYDIRELLEDWEKENQSLE